MRSARRDRELNDGPLSAAISPWRQSAHGLNRATLRRQKRACRSLAATKITLEGIKPPPTNDKPSSRPVTVECLDCRRTLFASLCAGRRSRLADADVPSCGLLSREIRWPLLAAASRQAMQDADPAHATGVRLADKARCGARGCPLSPHTDDRNGSIEIGQRCRQTPTPSSIQVHPPSEFHQKQLVVIPPIC